MTLFMREPKYSYLLWNEGPLQATALELIDMSMRILFSGKKCFWKANKIVPVEVLMIQHHPMQIIEILACNLEMKCEAPHLYVSESVLLVKLGLGDSSCSKEVDITKAHYLLDNLILFLYLPESRRFELNIQQSSDELSKSECLLITKPVGLCAYVSPFVHIFWTNTRKSTLADESLSILADGNSATKEAESPRDEHPGIVESASLQHQQHQQQRNPAGKLPSPKSITCDLGQHQMPHGAPPRPLYPMKSSTSSPNLSNPAGSLTNPRIVSRRVPALLIGAHQKGGQAASSLPPLAPQALQGAGVSANSAKGSPSLSYAAIPCRLFEQVEAMALVDTHLVGSVRADIDSDHECDNEGDTFPTNLQLKPTNSPRKTGASAGTPPLHTRIILGTAEKVGAATWEYHQQQQLARVEMKGHHRRHTYDHAVSIPSALAAAAVGETAADSTTGTSGSGIPLSPRSAKSRLMGMRAALDGLRTPFMHSPRSKVSPSVSSIALDEEDLQELEEHPFGLNK